MHMTQGGREGALMQDQYVLHTAEDQQISLPFSCRHGWIPECLLSELGQDFFGVYVAEEVITTKSFFSEVSKVYCYHVYSTLNLCSGL